MNKRHNSDTAKQLEQKNEVIDIEDEDEVVEGVSSEEASLIELNFEDGDE